MLEKKEKHLLILLTIWLFKKENRTKKQNIFLYKTNYRENTNLNKYSRYIRGHLSRHFCVKIQMVYVGFMTNDIFQILYFLSIILKQREYDRNLLFIYQCTLLLAASAYKGISSFNDYTYS